MTRRIAVVGAMFAALALSASAGAAPPLHESFTFHDEFVDDSTCLFAIAGETTFTNDVMEVADSLGGPAKVTLHQTTTGTLTANGTTIRMHVRETILVQFVDGVAVTAKHVGLLDSLVGPGGPIFHRSGQALYEVLGGFDGPLVARHGLRDVFEPAELCAAFA